MTNAYRLVGSQDPASRIERVRVESPSEDYPEGKFLSISGPPAELSDEQVTILSSYVRLEQVSDEEREQQEEQGEPLLQFQGAGVAPRFSKSTDIDQDAQSDQAESGQENPSNQPQPQATSGSNPAVAATQKSGDAQKGGDK